MGDLYLSRQGQLQSRIPITAFFICIREKRKKLSVICALETSASQLHLTPQAFVTPTRTGETGESPLNWKLAHRLLVVFIFHISILYT